MIRGLRKHNRDGATEHWRSLLSIGNGKLFLIRPPLSLPDIYKCVLNRFFLAQLHANVSEAGNILMQRLVQRGNSVPSSAVKIQASDLETSPLRYVRVSHDHDFHLWSSRQNSLGVGFVLGVDRHLGKLLGSDLEVFIVLPIGGETRADHIPRHLPRQIKEEAKVVYQRPPHIQRKRSNFVDVRSQLFELWHEVDAKEARPWQV